MCVDSMLANTTFSNRFFEVSLALSGCLLETWITASSFDEDRRASLPHAPCINLDCYATIDLNPYLTPYLMNTFIFSALRLDYSHVASKAFGAALQSVLGDGFFADLEHRAQCERSLSSAFRSSCSFLEWR